MSEKCQGHCSTGKLCSFNASWHDGNGYYCKRHAPDGCEEIPKSRSQASSPRRVPIDMIYNEISECIRRRVEICDADEANCIAAFQRLKIEDRNIVIRRAMKVSGSDDDVGRIVRSLGTVLGEFERCEEQERLPIKLRNYHLEDIQAKCVSQNVVADLFYETDNFVTFPDVNISIANCSPIYLKASKTTFERICSKDYVIYMGPRGAAKTHTGEPLPPIDSEWYIPLPEEFPLRKIHNKIMVKKILAEIEEKPEEANKYLALRGKILLCVCMPSCCHCEVYVEIVRALLIPTE